MIHPVIIPLLADSTLFENWTALSNIINTLIGPAAIVISLLAWNKKQDVRVEQPVEIQFAKEYVHQSRFEAHEHDNLQAFRDLNLKREEDRDKADEGRARLYAKLGVVEAQLNAMPSRIVTDILNSKKLFER